MAKASNNATWMKTRIRDNNQDPYIYELKLPGTHHSSISRKTLHTSNAIDSNFKKYEKFSFLISPILKSWTACQHLSVHDQLEAGVRAFDVRVSFTQGNFHTSHSFMGPLLSNVLDGFVRFYKQHGTSEVIILRISKDSENESTMAGKEEEFNKLLSNHPIHQYFYAGGDPMQRLSTYDSTPIVLILDDGLKTSTGPGFDNPFYNKWYNTNTDVNLAVRISQNLNNNMYNPANSSQNISAIQLILTPREDDIVKGILTVVFIALMCLGLKGTIAFLVTSMFLKSRVILFNSLALVSFSLLVGVGTYMLVMGRSPFSIFDMSRKISKEFFSYSKNGQYNIVSVDFVDREFCDTIISRNGRREENV